MNTLPSLKKKAQDASKAAIEAQAESQDMTCDLAHAKVEEAQRAHCQLTMKIEAEAEAINKAIVEAQAKINMLIKAAAEAQAKMKSIPKVQAECVVFKDEVEGGKAGF